VGEGGAVLIILYPQYSHALYLDSSRNIKKKDYTHIRSVLDSAMITFSLSGGYIKVKKHRKNGLGFGHKTDFCCIQQPKDSKADGFYLMHHMLDYRRDNQRLRMSPTSNDAEIVNWATSIGRTPDHRIRAEFYHVQCELAQVIMKEVLEQTGMFYHGPMTRDDVRALLVAQRLDLKPFTKLGCFLPDYEDWNADMEE
jgi:hypothetical protein